MHYCEFQLCIYFNAFSFILRKPIAKYQFEKSRVSSMCVSNNGQIRAGLARDDMTYVQAITCAEDEFQGEHYISVIVSWKNVQQPAYVTDQGHIGTVR